MSTMTRHFWQWPYMALILKGGWHLEPHAALEAMDNVAKSNGVLHPGRVFLLLSKRLEKESANT